MLAARTAGVDKRDVFYFSEMEKAPMRERLSYRLRLIAHSRPTAPGPIFVL